MATATRKKRYVRDGFADAFAFRKVLGRLWPHVDSLTRSKSADSLQVHSWFAVGFYQQLAVGAMSSAQWNGRMTCAAHHTYLFFFQLQRWCQTALESALRS